MSISPLATTCPRSRCRCWPPLRTSGRSWASPPTSWSPWRRTSPRSSAAASGSAPTVAEKIFSNCPFDIFSMFRWWNQPRCLHRHAAQPCQELRGGVFNSRGDTADCQFQVQQTCKRCLSSVQVSGDDMMAQKAALQQAGVTEMFSGRWLSVSLRNRSQSDSRNKTHCQASSSPAPPSTP